MKQAQVSKLSEEAYLEGERASPVRHEYLAGEVFAMAGASKAHNTIAGNVFALLRSGLRGGPCRAYISDMKLRIAAQPAYYYPDVTVTCSGTDLAADSPKDYLESPTVIVEVLSPATEAIDRREKMLAYRHLASLEEYVLIDQDRGWVEVYRRSEGGWNVLILTPGDSVPLESVGLSLTLDEIYEGSGALA